MIIKNIAFFGLVAGVLLAMETGYFAGDRTPRAQSVALEALAKAPGKVVFEPKIDKDSPARTDQADGVWKLYNGANPDTLSVDGSALVMRYAIAWLGVYFDHKAYEPHGLYRVRFEAKVENEPAALLVRNRQLDLMRQQIPVTGGTFKEFKADYAAPGGRLDQVRLILMPDGREKVNGSISIRNVRIERLGR